MIRREGWRAIRLDVPSMTLATPPVLPALIHIAQHPEREFVWHVAQAWLARDFTRRLLCTIRGLGIAAIMEAHLAKTLALLA